MREIKFRAWDKLGDDEGTSCMRLWENLLKDRYAHTADSIFNDPLLILMQYTGLKDKTGVEIYEGDIVKRPDGKSAVVTWDNIMARYCLDPEYYGEAEDGFNYGLEVIGNIYENPGLLPPVSTPL